MPGRHLASRLRWLAGPRGGGIPLADLALLERAWRRARAIRLGLLVALVACIVAGFFVAPATPGRRFLPANTVGIVVLDVSASIKPATYYEIEHELATLAATKDRLGLVLFSDVAYEALPPGTPASQLRPLLRFFAPPTPQDLKRANVDAAEGIPDSPWQQWFSGGTVVSNGLDLAAQMLQRDHVQHGAVVLMSDLADDPTDTGALASTVLMYQERHIPLEIVGLAPTPANAEYFKALLGSAIVQTATLPSGAEARGKLDLVGSFPRPLAVVASLCVLLLALDAWWAEPLRWRPRRAEA